MRLSEAMSVLRVAASPSQGLRRWHLVSSFEPLHLEIFLRAFYKMAHPDESLEILSGSYGSLSFNLANALNVSSDGCIVIMSWEDIDSRLSWRGNGSFAEIRNDVFSGRSRIVLSGLVDQSKQLANTRPVLFVPPILPLLPFDVQRRMHAGAERTQLRLLAAELTAEFAALKGVTCMDSEELAFRLPPLKQDLNHLFVSGFPFTLEACSVLAKEIVGQMKPPEPLRGLITDLDNTLWKGIVGEDGVDGICWDLDGKAQHHALYQRLLSSLAESGVLLGVASRNDLEVVESAFNRADLLIKPSSLFPVETRWDSKVESIKRILSVWNIGAEHVLYVDDDPREIDRIQKAFPAINCRVFSFKNDALFSDFIFDIRDLFAKPCIIHEDSIRALSIRSQVVLNNVAEDFNEDKFHQTIEARLTITDTRTEKDSRSLDLISKTNQFNMNGARPTKAEWAATLKEGNMIVFTFGYEDRYGPLGRIAVVAGVQHDGVLTLKNWVMSCRAFNRRIEFACLAWLFKTTSVYEVHTSAVHTKRNAVFFNVLDAFGVSETGIIHREAFMAVCPKLSFSYHLL